MSVYVGASASTLDSVKPPDSANVEIADFDGTWKLDTSSSETLEAYLKTRRY